jgi:hypothetical protein
VELRIAVIPMFLEVQTPPVVVYGYRHPYFVGTKDCGHSFVHGGTDTSSFVFKGIDILIAFGFSFLALPMRSWVLLLGFHFWPYRCGHWYCLVVGFR